MHIDEVLPRDAIPSIDEPAFGTEYFGDDDDGVIVVEDEPPRAYPIRILSYHEIVNDHLESDFQIRTTSDSAGQASQNRRAIAVTWCPICASGVVYDRTVDGQMLTFGTSGKLADDALVMYDRETGSEWKQPLGRAISGPLEGTELTALPASVMSWEMYRTDHPDGVVLQPVHGGPSDPRGGSPRAAYDMSGYDRYDESDDFGLRAMRGEGKERTWSQEDIDAKTEVIGVVHENESVGYPKPVIESEGGLVRDTVDGLNILVVSSGHSLDVFENPGYDFEVDGETLVADGASWDRATGRSNDGRELRRIPSRRLYAFAWQDDHGVDSFYGLSASVED